MKNSGKDLEKFVSRIESYMLPLGFEVITNDKIFNDDGVQVAEFDVEIAGKLGSTEIKWLIECRDRPSSGKAPASWIEQLVGRRDRFQFSKVTAVSTSGFSPSAIQYAIESGIETRVVDSISSEKVWEWFRFSELSCFKDHAKVTNVKFYFSDRLSVKAEKALKLFMDDLELNSQAFFSPHIDRSFSAFSMFQDFLQQNPDSLSAIEPNSKEIDHKFVVNVPTGAKGIILNFEKHVYHVARIDFFATITRELLKVPVDSLFEYRSTNDKDVIAQTARFNVEIDNQKFEIDFEKIHQTDELKLSVSKKE